MIKECSRTVHVTWMVVGLSTTGLCKRTMTSPSSFCTCRWSTPWAGGLMSVEEARRTLARRHHAIIEIKGDCIVRWEREEEMTRGFKQRCQKIVTTESIKKNITKAKKRFFGLKIIKWNCHNQMTALMFPFFLLKLTSQCSRVMSKRKRAKESRVSLSWVQLSSPIDGSFEARHFKRAFLLPVLIFKKHTVGLDPAEHRQRWIYIQFHFFIYPLGTCNQVTAVCAAL